MHAENDQTLVLANKSGFGEVTMCSCGVLSLHLGNTTIRFESTALSQLDDLIQTALDAMIDLAAQNRIIGVPVTGLVH